MMRILKWKSKSLSNSYEIFEEDKQVGSLKKDLFSSIVIGTLNKTNVVYKSKGIIKQHIEITNKGSDEVIGVVTFDDFMSNTKIIINGISYNWKYTDIWNSKWKVFSDNGVDIKFKKNNNKGIIESRTDDSLLILTGLYTHIYYIQTLAILLFIVLIPVWISVFNN